METKLLPCPFCGQTPDIENNDTLHPDGVGWKYSETLGCRTYHSYRDVPKEQWCYVLNCSCPVEMHGDSIEEVIALWNKRKS